MSPTGVLPSGGCGISAVWSDPADGFYIFGGLNGPLTSVWLYQRQAKTLEMDVWNAHQRNTIRYSEIKL